MCWQLKPNMLKSWGVLPSYDLKKQIELVNESNIFNEAGKQKASKGFAQLGRNF